MAREGFPFVAGFLVAGAILWIAGLSWGAFAAAVLALGCLGFFRDPERVVPSDPEAIVAPADGKVVAVEEREEGTRVSVFLSVFDVHVNRAPIAGRVGEVVHTPGRFLAAFAENASEVNEQTAIPLRGEAGSVVVKQIAGLIARRIVCRVSEGDRLEAGERFGLIRFGSRTDLLLPAGVHAVVHRGDRVRGGETIVARWSRAGSSPREESAREART